MRNWTINAKDIIILAFIVLTAVWRVTISLTGEISAISNFSPLGAMALFGGVYFSRAKGFAFPLLTLWISDIFMNRFVFYGEWKLFYEGFYWTYGAFALMVLVGKWMQSNKSVGRFIGSSLLIVLIHWIVTDIGVWLGNSTYPQTIEGFWMCLLAAIPFERNLLVGTIVYGSVPFGVFEWLKYKWPALQTSHAKVNQ